MHRVPEAIDSISTRLPEGFPAAVFDTISKGMSQAARQMANEPDKRG